MICLKAFNAIYGIIKAALLFYKQFVGDLSTIGFNINPYDPYVANKITNGKKMTLLWHVNGIKVSHENKKIFTRMAKWLYKTYERVFEYGPYKIKISRDKIHGYLDMALYLS